MKEEKKRLRPLESSTKVMSPLWFILLAFGFSLGILLVVKVVSFDPDDPYNKYFRPQNKKVVIIPSRGDILDCKNRALATSSMVYDVNLDCMAASDSLWDNNVLGLAEGLASLLGDKNVAQYLNLLNRGRSQSKRFLFIGKDIPQKEINVMRTLPIFKENKYKGGYLESKHLKRFYPYGNCAFRTLGYVKNNASSKYNKIGIEGNFDKYLHGEDGVQLFSRCDFGMIPLTDSTNRKAHDGFNVKTTLDIDIQTIADEALRKIVESQNLIEKSCVIVLETSTGAIKAMVNLGRDKKGKIGEWDNYAIRMAEAPGSVFKGAVVMAMLEEGYLTTLDKKIPTYGGVWTYNGQKYDDTKHLGRHRFPSGYVKVRQAFEMSANNTFRQLICDDASFGNNPSRFVKKIKDFGLIDTIDFDIKGNTPPFILSPDMKKRSAKGFWDGGTFARMAIGYGMELSPLNIVCFYNAIANDGKMMKPYIVDAILDHNKEVEKFSPQVMRERICTQATVDTLKNVMSMVANDKNGTAYYQLHGAVCPIAGKTGTAQRIFTTSSGKRGFHDNANGNESHQGSFVGFFPSDKPEYTAIVVVWSKPSNKNFFGATYAAPVFREIADKIYCLNDEY